MRKQPPDLSKSEVTEGGTIGCVYDGVWEIRGFRPSPIRPSTYSLVETGGCSFAGRQTWSCLGTAFPVLKEPQNHNSLPFEVISPNFDERALPGSHMHV